MSPTAAARLEQRVDSVLALMTLEEKAGQLSITGGRPDLDDRISAGRLGGTNGVLPGQDVAALTRHFQRVAMQSRLKIPLLFMGDVIHGFRTVYPVPLAMAATWDTTLVTSVDSASAAEATAVGVDWTFAPMLDIGRDPRWGRVVEGPGEDPYLGAALARAQVRGYQGDVTGAELAAPTTMAATAKHFAGYGAVQAGRDYNSVDLSDRRFRSVYLPTFHAVVNAGVATIMAAFTALNGVPSTANVWLLKGILRDEWGFQGVVVSDYDAVPELENHRIAANDAEAVALAMGAGVDVDLHSLTYADQLPGLVRSGRVSEAAVDSAVRRVLRLKFRLGLFDDPFRYDDAARAKAVTLSPSQRALARRAAAESFVLLENHGVLPLSPALKTVAVIGPLANDSANPLGPVHAVGRPADTRTVLKGIRDRLGAGVQVLYARGAGIGVLSPAGAAGTSNAAAGSGAADTAGIAHAAALAKRAGAAVVVVGEAASMSGEGGSRSRLDLPGAQLALVKAVVATGTPTVVVLMSGRPLTSPWLSEHAPAVLETWFPGTEAGDAIADVLFGDAEPGGRLPISFPRDVGQIPIFYAHRSTGRPAVASDRYTSKYLDVANSPLYPFGYGLGYTRFAYSNVRVDRAQMGFGDTVHVSVTVRNVGQRAGTDVVQLYVTDEEASVSPVVERLRGFRRVRLAPGEARQVSFPLTTHDLALFSVDMKRYAAEPGWFTVSVGGNSRNAHEHQARFELVER
jgi:beta-glucosidase